MSTFQLNHHRLSPWFAALIALHSGSFVSAAEIALRDRCQPAGTLVTLGDLAEIRTNDRELHQTLAEIELFPVPATGGKSYVAAADVQDALALHGVNLGKHRLTGASKVEVLGAAVSRNRVRGPAPVASGAAAMAERRIQQALDRHLLEAYAQENPQGTLPRHAPWEAVCETPERIVRLLGGWAHDLKVEGSEAVAKHDNRSEEDDEPTLDDGGAPRIFHFTCRTTNGIERFSLEGTVAPRPLMVVTRRSIRLGEVLQAADLDLAPMPPEVEARKVFTSIDEAIGVETSRALAVDQGLPRDAVRVPRLVKRNDIVTVIARVGTIKASTQARAQGDGGEGDEVIVESLATRERFSTRVTGLHQVEALARSASGSAALDRETTNRIAASVMPARFGDVPRERTAKAPKRSASRTTGRKTL